SLRGKALRPIPNNSRARALLPVMTGLGQGRTFARSVPTSAWCQQQTTLIRCYAGFLSLLATKNSLFRLQGIRPRKPRVSMGLSKRGGGRSNGNSLYFPAYQGISLAETRSL